MIKFLLKGILRDKSRSLLPIIVVAIGVFLTVFLVCWITGALNDSIEMSANFNTGHLKVMTRAYEKDRQQMPNDLAIIGAGSLTNVLKKDYPQLDWVQRIRFGGLIDFPDANGETRVQGPVVGWGIDLFSPGSKEKDRFNIEASIVDGKYPQQPGDALITADFAQKYNVKPGDEFTFFGTTMDGSMAFYNFRVAGTVRFGSSALDRGAIIIDIKDAQQALTMDDAAGEILGYFPISYNQEEAPIITNDFNQQHANDPDEFAPVMITLREQEGMAQYLDYSATMSGIMVGVFVLAMSIVLWNAGLIGGLRRYNEFGIRLALGEEKKKIYLSLIYEAILIGIIGSVIGTLIGLAGSYYMQEVGINMGNMLANSSLMMPQVMRATITPAAFYIGFIPGLLSMVLGNALSGIAIYKRKTAELFKELEA